MYLDYDAIFCLLIAVVKAASRDAKAGDVDAIDFLEWLQTTAKEL